MNNVYYYIIDATNNPGGTGISLEDPFRIAEGTLGEAQLEAYKQAIIAVHLSMGVELPVFRNALNLEPTPVSNLKVINKANELKLGAPGPQGPQGEPGGGGGAGINFLEGPGINIVQVGSDITFSVNASEVDHGGLAGLGDDDHAQYLYHLPTTTRKNMVEIGNAPSTTIGVNVVTSDNTLVTAFAASLDNGGDSAYFEVKFSGVNIGVPLTVNSGVISNGFTIVDSNFDKSTAITRPGTGSNFNLTLPDAAASVNGSAMVFSTSGVGSWIVPVPTSRTITAGTGLSGGGDLSTNRSLSVVFGTGSGTVCEGNDSRLSNARTPTAHAASHSSGGSDPIPHNSLAGLTTGDPHTQYMVLNPSTWGRNQMYCPTDGPAIKIDGTGATAGVFEINDGTSVNVFDIRVDSGTSDTPLTVNATTTLRIRDYDNPSNYVGLKTDSLNGTNPRFDLTLPKSLPGSNGSALVSTTGGVLSFLALGGAAQLNVGTTAGTVAAGDDSRLSNARTPTSHVLATNAGLGSEHTISGATVGHVLRATGATTAQIMQLGHSDLGGLTSGDPHTQYLRGGTSGGRNAIVLDGTGVGLDVDVNGDTANAGFVVVDRVGSGDLFAVYASEIYIGYGGVTTTYLQGSVDLTAATLLANSTQVNSSPTQKTLKVDDSGFNRLVEDRDELIVSPRRRARSWHVGSDCFTNPIEGFYSEVSGGSGATNTPNFAPAGRKGVMQCYTGTSTNGKAGWSLNVYSFAFGDGEHHFQCALQTGTTASDGTDTFALYYGFGDNATGNSTDGVYFRYRHTENSGNWTAVCVNNGTETTADTGINAISNSYRDLYIRVNAAGTEAKFYIDGVLKATITTNIPTSAGSRNTGGVAVINKSAGTNGRSVFVDFVDYWGTLSSQRVAM